MKFSLDVCEVHTTCETCVGIDPLGCGWCNGKCSLHKDCSSGWTGNSCPPVIDKVSTELLSFHDNKRHSPGCITEVLFNFAQILPVSRQYYWPYVLLCPPITCCKAIVFASFLMQISPVGWE